MSYTANCRSHIFDNREKKPHGKSIWPIPFAIGFDVLIWVFFFFCIETINKSTLTLTQILAKCSHISFIACTVDKPLWQKTFEAWKMVCLRTCQTIFGHHLQVSAMIYTEERSVCFFGVVYTGLIISLEMHNWNAMDVNTIASWQEDKRGEKEERGECKKERRRKKKSLRVSGVSWQQLVSFSDSSQERPASTALRES